MSPHLKKAEIGLDIKAKYSGRLSYYTIIPKRIYICRKAFIYMEYRYKDILNHNMLICCIIPSTKRDWTRLRSTWKFPYLRTLSRQTHAWLTLSLFILTALRTEPRVLHMLRKYRVGELPLHLQSLHFRHPHLGDTDIQPNPKRAAVH